MSLTFYYSPMSTATITELVLEELAVPCERIKVDLKKGQNRTPDFLRLNPNSKVPVLVHDRTSIWESAAITLYLGEIFGVAEGLYPEPGPERGEAMKWIVWSNVTLGDAFGRLIRNTASWIPAEQHNSKAAEAAGSDVQDCLRILDRALDGRQYLLAGYTLADTHVNSYLDWLRYMKVDFSDHARLNAWSQRCAARPAYVRVMGRA
ncbi:MAG TPA: glutathione S-transferase family protein [Steroidobacteraceae bacterium]|nr:glutathione S-transferase family protein [Steroidobacteraceae bacterium]